MLKIRDRGQSVIFTVWVETKLQSPNSPCVHSLGMLGFCQVMLLLGQLCLRQALLGGVARRRLRDWEAKGGTPTHICISLVTSSLVFHVRF